MASKANHVLLTKENRKDFESVFPAVFRESDHRISIGAYREDGAVLSAISFVLVDNQYDIDWLYGKYPPGMFRLLQEAAGTAERLYPEDSLTFEAINEKSEKLAQRLFPNARSVAIYEAGW